MKRLSPKKVSQKLLRPSPTAARKQFVLENHRKLIDIMKEVPNNQHDQGTWGEYDPDVLTEKQVNQAPHCGTTCCALGWAGVSGEFDGLGVFATDGHIEPTINNSDQYVIDWDEVGVGYFGGVTFRSVFMDTGSRREKVIEKLEARVQQIESAPSDEVV